MKEKVDSPQRHNESKKTTPKKTKTGPKAKIDGPNLDQLIESFLTSGGKNSEQVDEKLATAPEKLVFQFNEITRLKNSEWIALTDSPNKYALSPMTWKSLLTWSQNPLLSLQLWGENSTSDLLKIVSNHIVKDNATAALIFDASRKTSILPKKKRLSLASELAEAIDIQKLESQTLLQFLYYLSSSGIQISQLLLKTSYLDETFNKLDETEQVKILISVKKLSFNDFLILFTRLEISKVRISVLKEIRSVISIEEILEFQRWENPTPKFSTAGFEIKVIKPLIEEKMKLSSALPELISLWPIIANPESEYDLPKFQEKLHSEINRETPLAKSLRNPEMAKLKGANGELVESVRVLNETLQRTEEKLERVSDALEEAHSDISALRNRISEMSKGDQIGLEARDNQIRIDLLRSLLPAMQRAIQAGNEEDILELLEKANIERVGKPGAKITWNPDSCESLTGEVSELVEVVESGYTWFNGTQTISLKRILVKNT